MSEKKRSWDEVKDAMFGAPWSDATLLEVEQEWRRLSQSKNAELYRLARLGLAAEQVGQRNLDGLVSDSDSAHFLNKSEGAALSAFLNHEAWGTHR